MVISSPKNYIYIHPTIHKDLQFFSLIYTGYYQQILFGGLQRSTDSNAKSKILN